MTGGGAQLNLGVPGIRDAVEVQRTVTHTTYRAVDDTGRTVGVTLLNAGRDWPGLAERFERDQTALERLRTQPNIVPILGHGWTVTGMPYVVTAELPTSTLTDRLRGPQPLTGPEVLAVGVKMAAALESVHALGVVHGDLRASDIVMAASDEPMLAGFGIVPLVEPYRVTSPEADVDALAGALLTTFGAGVPQPVADVLHAATATDPARRYQRAADLGLALQNAQTTLGLPRTDVEFVVARPAPPEPKAAAPSNVPLVLAGFVGGIAIVAVFAFLLTRGTGTNKVTRDAELTIPVAPSTTATTATTTTSTSSAPSGPVSPGSFVRITNDGGNVSVEVPSSWSQTIGGNLSNGMPNVVATPDARGYASDDFSVPAMNLSVWTASLLNPNDVDATVDEFMGTPAGAGTLAEICKVAPRTDLVGNQSGLIGRVQRLTNCGGSGDVVIAAATNQFHTLTALVIIHAGVPPDEAAIDRVLSSMTVLKFP